jgi:hypothetical protein
MKHIHSFESIQIIDKKLENDFQDIEDYFVDLFDETNNKWNIRVRFGFVGIQINITDEYKGHAYRPHHKEVILIKRNKIDHIVSNCMDRLASSKNLVAKFKKKRYDGGKTIGYSCSLFGYE